MATGLSRLLCQRQVRMRWSGDMNYVKLMRGEHAIKIRVPVRYGVANCELLGQNGLKVANRQHPRTSELLNFLDVTIGDFPTANDSNIQHQFLSIPAATRTLWSVCAATTGSRPRPIASIARYVCHAETK